MTAAEKLIEHYPIVLEKPEYFNVSSWTGHTPFAILVVAMTNPRIFVELGTHHGVSYMAFCQSVKKLNLETRCFAVDTWEGDVQAGRYNEYVLQQLKEKHDPRYGHFSTLLKMTFDEAVAEFENGSIDLLHIDGCHTYEAVKHDFQTWLSKMSDQGIILFHDTETRLEGYGVWKFWEEITPNYPSFNFAHYYGLGILAVGANYPSELDVFFKATSDEQESLRLLFYQLADRLYHDEMQARMEQLHAEVYFQHEAEFINYEHSLTQTKQKLEVQMSEIATLTALLKQEKMLAEEARTQLLNNAQQLQALNAQNQQSNDALRDAKAAHNQQRLELEQLRSVNQNQSYELAKLRGNRVVRNYMRIREHVRALWGKP